MALKNLTFERIKIDSINFVAHSGDSYLQTYPEFLSYFYELEHIKRKHLVIAAHFVYGWMPTILTLKLEDEERVLRILNLALSGQLLDGEQLDLLKKCVNNSMVGSSKLLHFINPRVYAIWDSRIFRYATGKKSQYGIGNSETYLKYLKRLREIASNPKYATIHRQIENHLGLELSPMRVIEIIMFEADRNRSKQ